MKTAALIGGPLDYWTGRACGIPEAEISLQTVPRTDSTICVRNGKARYAPSTDPVQGLALIESMVAEGFSIGYAYGNGVECANVDDDGVIRIGGELKANVVECGATALIAACRAKVASVFGDTVEDVLDI